MVEGSTHPTRNFFAGLATLVGGAAILCVVSLAVLEDSSLLYPKAYLTTNCWFAR
jgi:hypothetical protein